MTSTTNRETIDVEGTGQTVVLGTYGNDTLSVTVRGDGAADYAIDVTDDPDNAWLQGSETLTGSTDYDETFTIGAPYVRLRCTSGTGTADNTAEVLLASSGA